jgi:hypothetical protein
MNIKDRDQEVQRRRQHIVELKDKVTAISGYSDNTFISPDCPDEIAEKFLQQVLAFEESEEKPLSDELMAKGIALPQPEELDDEQLRIKLWEVIHAMAHVGHYLHNTDHLSDRQLYERLIRETLPVPTILKPENPNFACHIDLVGTGSEEDLHLYLKYYAEEEYRQQWSQHWPDDTIPPHEDPPHDRDRHLPNQLGF